MSAQTYVYASRGRVKVSTGGLGRRHNCSFLALMSMASLMYYSQSIFMTYHLSKNIFTSKLQRHIEHPKLTVYVEQGRYARKHMSDETMSSYPSNNKKGCR